MDKTSWTHSMCVGAESIHLAGKSSNNMSCQKFKYLWQIYNAFFCGKKQNTRQENQVYKKDGKKEFSVFRGFIVLFCGGYLYF